MKLYNKESAKELINFYSERSIPFLCIIDFEMQRNLVLQVDDINPDLLQFNINGCKNDTLSTTHIFEGEVSWKVKPPTFEQYKKSFDIVLSALKRGDSFLINYTCQSNITTNLSLQKLYTYSKAKYKLWIKDLFTVLSPETFIKINNNRISSYPMKGTIDASIPDAAKVILENKKETAEHATIVDLIRNDLSIVADQVEVERYRYIDTLSTNKGALLQVSSEITGVIKERYKNKIGDVLFQLLPAGSISGAPKKRTLEVIHEAETYTRGYYTGIVGYFDGESFDSGVMIRFIEQLPDGSLVFKSGGGITAQSNVRDEYEEIIAKIYAPLRRNDKNRVGQI